MSPRPRKSKEDPATRYQDLQSSALPPKGQTEKATTDHLRMAEKSIGSPRRQQGLPRWAGRSSCPTGTDRKPADSGLLFT